jgi:hypothetical protein
MHTTSKQISNVRSGLCWVVWPEFGSELMLLKQNGSNGSLCDQPPLLWQSQNLMLPGFACTARPSRLPFIRVAWISISLRGLTTLPSSDGG